MGPTFADTSCFIDKLTLENYRCFAGLSLSFDSRLTVLVAPNGGGKTAVLDALAIALKLFVDTAEGRQSSKGFDSTDIRLTVSPANTMEPVTPVKLEVSGVILGEPLSWIRERQSISSSRTTTADAKSLKELAMKMTLMNQKWSRVKHLESSDIKNVPISPVFPLISYYGTGRLWSNTRFTSLKREKISAPNARSRGYTDCLSSSSRYKDFIDWFRRFSYEAKKEGKGQAEVRQQAGLVLAAVQHAVNVALRPSGWKNLEWDFAEEIVVAHHAQNGKLPVSYLSDGIRNTIGLVADMAHRMVRLNPQLKERAVMETPGIVLIDEVDMHLHPEWQQRILSSLMKAFPKLQFVVTTHSPQVLSTVRKENVRVLKSDDAGNWTATAPANSPIGQESIVALANIMETHPRPDIPGLLKNLHTYELLVRSGQGQSERAINALHELNDLGFEFSEAEKRLFEILKKRATDKSRTE